MLNKTTLAICKLYNIPKYFSIKWLKNEMKDVLKTKTEIYSIINILKKEKVIENIVVDGTYSSVKKGIYEDKKIFKNNIKENTSLEDMFALSTLLFWEESQIDFYSSLDYENLKCFKFYNEVYCSSKNTRDIKIVDEMTFFCFPQRNKKIKAEKEKYFSVVDEYFAFLNILKEENKDLQQVNLNIYEDYMFEETFKSLMFLKIFEQNKFYFQNKELREKIEKIKNFILKNQ